MKYRMSSGALSESKTTIYTSDHILGVHTRGIQKVSHTRIMYSRSKNTPTYFTTNYRTEMKLVPIIMDYCLLYFDALKIFLGVHLNGGDFYLTLIFRM